MSFSGQARRNLHNFGLTSPASCEFAINVHEVGEVLRLFGLG